MYKIQPKTKIVGKNLIYLPSCHSTNQIAFDLIQNQQISNGSIVITDNQTHGKGQRGNHWYSKEKLNLTMSLVLETNFLSLNKIFDLSKLVSLSILDAIKNYGKHPFKLKWPNDIYYEKKKIGGILIENSIQGKTLSNSVIGIGLNINQTDFDIENANSLKNINDDIDIKFEPIIEKFCESFENRINNYLNNQAQMLNQEYLDNLLFYKEKATFQDLKQNRFEGIIVDVDENGLLIIDINHQLTPFDIKELTFLF